jgi:competence protein ComGC
MNPLDEAPGWMVAFFAVGLSFIAVVFVLVITALLKTRRALRDAGLNPLTAPAQLASRLLSSQALAPAQRLELRLVELEDLRRRGVISEQEHTAARARALAGE